MSAKYIYMYVCMYACMYVRMYVRMCVYTRCCRAVNAGAAVADLLQQFLRGCQLLVSFKPEVVEISVMPDR